MDVVGGNEVEQVELFQVPWNNVNVSFYLFYKEKVYGSN